MLEPLKSFDWTTKTSPLSSLGGMKGVNEAHRILSETLGNKDQEKSSSRPIQNSKERQLEDFLLNPES